jgi:hypothetical protein
VIPMMFLDAGGGGADDNGGRQQFKVDWRAGGRFGFG